MKIRKLQLKNIGVFDDETIEFPPCPAKDKAEIHILTGENGSGKSTILMALADFWNYRKEIITNETLYANVTSLPFQKRFRPKAERTLDVEDLFSNEPQKSLYQYKKVLDDYAQGKHTKMSFAFFAYSGYRRIKDEPIEIGKEVDENPLNQALDFIKDENSKFTINQWLGRNIIDSSLAKGKSRLDEAKIIDKKIENLEKAIIDIIGYKIKFEMQSATKLILIKNNQELDFDVLPDGLKSLISWIGDLLMRLDSLKWENDMPIFDREIILFLDEIEVHLHPAWQRKILPVVQKLFKNAQIFVSTHSPFVVNSVDDAWVYKLELENGKAKVVDVIKSEDGYSYSYVLSEIFGVNEEFGIGVQQDLIKFKELRNQIIQSKNGNDKLKKEILKLAKTLAVQSEELQTIVQFELRQINKRKGTDLTI